MQLYRLVVSLCQPANMLTISIAAMYNYLGEAAMN